MSPRYIPTFVAVFAAIAVPQAVFAAGPSAVLPYIGDDVAGVVCIDLTKIDAPAALEQIHSQIRSSGEDFERAKPAGRIVQSSIDQFHRLGVSRTYLLFRANDFVQCGATWVVPVDAGGDAEAALALLRRLVPPGMPGSRNFIPRCFTIADGVILAAATPDQLAKLKTGRRGEKKFREDAREAIGRLAGHAGGAVLFGDADSRRVIREMSPKLPAPFEKIDGRFIADEIRWIGLTVDFAPDLRLRATLQLTDAAKAAAALAAIDRAREMGESHLNNRPGDVAVGERARIAGILGLLHPVLEGPEVSLTLGDQPGEIASLAGIISGTARTAREATGHAKRMNQFKWIALAFHNYHDRYKTFPPAAIRDKNGKPLLSWRVAVLPYLEQEALYKEFHLDEPWDSEHNRKLIARMPDVFGDPDPEVLAAIGEEGKTTFVVPTGEGTLFRGGKGKSIKEIRDGTSFTVLAVEVVPRRAVVWTKPDDWKVDWKDPLDGVRRTDGRPFTYAMCDGSVQTFDADNAAAEQWWKKVLTPAGGEVVEPPE